MTTDHHALEGKEMGTMTNTDRGDSMTGDRFTEVAEPAHTEGPWVAVTAPANELRGAPKQTEIRSHGLVVTRLSSFVSDADARLIAAAPEMLAALKAAHEILIELTKPDMRRTAGDIWCSATQVEAMARFAIAKAEGKS